MAEQVNIRVNATMGDLSGIDAVRRRMQEASQGGPGVGSPARPGNAWGPGWMPRMPGGTGATYSPRPEETGGVDRLGQALQNIPATARRAFMTLQDLGRQNRERGFLGKEDVKTFETTQRTWDRMRQRSQDQLADAMRIRERYNTLGHATPAMEATVQERIERLQAHVVGFQELHPHMPGAPTLEALAPPTPSTPPSMRNQILARMGISPQMVGNMGLAGAIGATGVGMAARTVGSFWGPGAASGATIGAGLGAMLGSPLFGIGAVPGAAIGAGIGMVAGGVMDMTRRITPNVSSYEDIAKSLTHLRQLGGLTTTQFEKMEETLTDVRKGYGLMASQGIAALTALATVGVRNLPLSLINAAHTAQVYGIEPGQAGTMQGTMERLTVNRGQPLSALAATVGYRQGITLPMAGLLEQGMQIAGFGGAGVPQMPETLAGREVEFFGRMGPRYQGRQAEEYARFATGAGTPGDEITQAMRAQAIQRLSRRLPGGILAYGTERINLKTVSGFQQAMELGGIIPDVKQAYAEESERYAAGNEDLALQYWQNIFNVDTMQRTMDQRRTWRSTGQFAGGGVAGGFPTGGALTEQEQAAEAARTIEAMRERQATQGGRIELRDAMAELQAASSRLTEVFSNGQTAVENWMLGVVNGTSALQGFTEQMVNFMVYMTLGSPVGTGTVLAPVSTVPMRPR